MRKSNYHVLGVMSGTSLDGIDIAEVQFYHSETNSWKFEICNSETIPYSESWKEKLKGAIFLNDQKLDFLNKEYTEHLGDVLRNFILKYELMNLDAVCSHGHTILHQPDKGLTLQIGNLPLLADLIRNTVVCDFRVQDVKLGGQGAPLVPVGDRLLFKDFDYCLNLGGFANVSSEAGVYRLAYDICPVNIVLNRYAEMKGKPYDDNGNLAANGRIDHSILKRLNELAYYRHSPPKSLGLEWVQRYIFPILGKEGLVPEDILRTFVEHISIQIAAAIPKGSSILVTGGGAFNNYLLRQIEKNGALNLIIPSKEIIEFKEALIFGLLGVLKLRDENNCLASVTGAQKDHSSGKVFFK